MRTNFDKITESPETLADWIYRNEYNICKICIHKDFKHCDKNSPCTKGITEWLQQPLSMSEQFTDDEIDLAKMLIRKGEKTVEYRVTELACQNYFGEYTIYPNTYRWFRHLDKPIELEKIINSKGDKK